MTAKDSRERRLLLTWLGTALNNEPLVEYVDHRLIDADLTIFWVFWRGYTMGKRQGWDEAYNNAFDRAINGRKPADVADRVHARKRNKRRQRAKR